jgi:hypothetical protein
VVKLAYYTSKFYLPASSDSSRSSRCHRKAANAAILSEKTDGFLLLPWECGKCNSYAVVGKVTVIKLLRYVTSYFLKVTSNSFVTYKIAVTSNCIGTVTFKSG